MANQFLRNLLEKSNERFDIDTSGMSYTDWLVANTTLRGRPFSIDNHQFQRAIIDDDHPNMDVIKCSQVGLTEIQIRKMLAFLVRNQGLSAIFTLPNEKMFKRVSQTRVKPLIEADKVFNKERDEGSVRSMGLMQFGQSFLYLTGCTEGDATSIPADAVFNDEVDISPQDMLALFSSRLQGSDYKINQRFGTPTFPSFGTDMGFQSSDQHRFLIKCDRCNHWNDPQFSRRFVVVPGLPDYIADLPDIEPEIMDELDINGSYVCCEKCHAELDMGDWQNRQWVPKYPNRKHARGYHVTPFCTPKLPPSYILDQLLKYKRRDYLRGFYNTVLGLPYSDGNIQLDREVVQGCFTGQSTLPKIHKGNACCVGIDMGQTCHIVVGEGTDPANMHVFMWKAVHVDDIVEEVEKVCQAYNVVAGAVDRHPYEPTADDIFRASKGRIVPTEYRGTKEVNLVQNPTGDDFSHAQVDRTKMLDEVVRAVKNQPGLRFSGYGQYRETIIQHLRDMIRDEQPEKPAEWKKLTGNDHFFHALGFLCVSTKIQQVARVKRKDDIRTMASASLVDLNDDAGQIYGNGNKSLERGVLG